MLNVAVTVLAADIVVVHVLPAPGVQFEDQEMNWLPESGLAVSVTVVPRT